MIFKETWRWVLDKSPHTGEPKTQTRRRGKRRYKIGGIYAVQPGRGKTGKGFIRILDSWEERVALFPAGVNMEQAHRFARAEGVLDVGHFWSLWTKLYGRGAASEPCVAYEFEKMEGGGGTSLRC